MAEKIYSLRLDKPKVLAMLDIEMDRVRQPINGNNNGNANENVMEMVNGNGNGKWKQWRMFQELTMMTPKWFPRRNTGWKIHWGLPDNLQGKVIAAEPKTYKSV
ncbi:hypothetical protein Tco_0364369 [Tanacetum coccineum]